MTHNTHKANRLKHIEPFHVMDILARAKALEQQGRSIIHLEVGEPDFPTADPIIEAAHQALRDKHTHYTAAMGLPELRQAIAGYYQQRFHVDIPWQRIAVTPGASGALQLALAVLLNRDEQVMLADPGYPCNRHFVHLLEGRSQPVNVTAEDGYQLSGEHIRQYWSDSTVAAMIASPSNPTGSILSRSVLRDIIGEVKARQGQLIVDEIYQGLVYDQKDFTALSEANDIFVINSFSKYFGMTGWRLGWMVVPEAYVDDVDKLAQNIYLAAPTLSQYGALAAFSPECIAIFNQRRDAFKKRRDYLLAELLRLGFKVQIPPAGAFYIYADCSSFSQDSMGFVYELLEHTGVAITPGIDFGQYRAGQHLRFAYTRPVEVLQDAVLRLEKYLLS